MKNQLKNLDRQRSKDMQVSHIILGRKRLEYILMKEAIQIQLIYKKTNF